MKEIINKIFESGRLNPEFGFEVSVYLNDEFVTDMDVDGDWLPILLRNYLSEDIYKVFAPTQEEVQSKLHDKNDDLGLFFDAHFEESELDEEIQEHIDRFEDEDIQWLKNLPDTTCNFMCEIKENYNNRVIHEYKLYDVPIMGAQLLQAVAELYQLDEDQFEALGLEDNMFCEYIYDEVLPRVEDDYFTCAKFLAETDSETDRYLEACAQMIELVAGGKITEDQLETCYAYFEDEMYNDNEDASFESYINKQS